MRPQVNDLSDRQLLIVWLPLTESGDLVLPLVSSRFVSRVLENWKRRHKVSIQASSTLCHVICENALPQSYSAVGRHPAGDARKLSTIAARKVSSSFSGF